MDIEQNDEDLGDIEQETQQKSQEKNLPPSEREAVMESLAAARKAVVEQEAGIKPESPPEKTPDQEADHPQEVDRQIAAQENLLADEALKTTKVRAKIDGEEREVSVDEILRGFQKNEAADARLAKAAQILREAEAKAAEQKPEPLGQEDEIKNMASTLARTLFMGTEEEATEELAKALTKIKHAPATQAPSVDTAQIAQMVKQQLEVDRALEQSKKDYPEMYSDPDMEEFAAVKITRAIESGKTFTDALTTVGKELDDKFGWSKGRQVGDNVTPIKSRVARLTEKKAGIDNLPSVNTQSANPSLPTPSPSDVIADMRRARGLD